MLSFKNLFNKKTAGDEKFFLTQKGLRAIKKEYESLKAVKTLKTTGEMPHFMHSDDLDPEYLNLQDDLELLESKIFDLEYILKNVKLIKAPPQKLQNTIQLGAKVLLDIDGQKDEFKIVGTFEANPFLGQVSDESPVGRALLGHKVGEEVIISSPIKTHYRIKKIKYS